MNESRRYFINNIVDYTQGDPKIDGNLQKQRTLQLIRSVLEGLKKSDVNVRIGLLFFGLISYYY